MGVSAGEISGTGDDADGKYRGDGGGPLHRVVERPAGMAAERHLHSYGGVSDRAEAGIDRGAGSAFFVLYHAVPGYFVYHRNIRRGIVGRRPANRSWGGNRSREAEDDARHFLHAAEFREFQRDERGGSRA